jgi:phosphate transport system substrate-binding protein
MQVHQNNYQQKDNNNMKRSNLLRTAALVMAFIPGVAGAEYKLVIKGSDTLGAKLVPQLAEAYKEAGNEVSFEITAEGSSTCFTNLLAGTSELGMSSRTHKDEEADKFTAAGMDLVQHVAAWDMIAVIVNEACPVDDLTLEQIEGIFTGDITDWSEVGGPAGEISAYTRNTSSGTYKTFQELAMSKRDYGSNTQKMAGNEQIAQEVGTNPNGIGYVGLAYTKAEGIKCVSVDGNEVDPARVADYPVARKLYYYSVGQPEGEAGKFLAWATSDAKAGKVVERVGFIPLK